MTRDQGQLSGKVVVVIGGARGIGRGIVERCAAEGARLVIADLNQERDNVALALGGPAVALPLDARVAEDHERMAAEIMARFGRIDVLVYYAGIFPRATLLETDESLWHAVLDTNLTGSFLACHAVVPHMAARGGGAIITIGSLHAHRGSANMLAYAVSKGGLVTLTRNLAGALAPQGIRVNCVNPGWVLSEGEMAVQHVAPDQAERFAEDVAHTMPLGRLQTAQDIAHAVVYLASAQAAQVTAQIIDVDGGLGCRF